MNSSAFMKINMDTDGTHVDLSSPLEAWQRLQRQTRINGGIV